MTSALDVFRTVALNQLEIMSLLIALQRLEQSDGLSEIDRSAFDKLAAANASALHELFFDGRID